MKSFKFQPKPLKDSFNMQKQDMDLQQLFHSSRWRKSEQDIANLAL